MKYLKYKILFDHVIYADILQKTGLPLKMDKKITIYKKTRGFNMTKNEH